MATLRDLVAKAVAAGFTGKNYRNASTGVKPSPCRQHIGNPDFDQLGKRQQKIVRRMAMGDAIAPPNATDKYLAFWKPLVGSDRWRLISADDIFSRRCNVRAKDAKAIGKLTVDLGWNGFSAMLDAVRSHYL